MIGRLHQELHAQHVRVYGVRIGGVGRPAPRPHVGDDAQVGVAAVHVDDAPTRCIVGGDIIVGAHQVLAESHDTDSAEL